MHKADERHNGKYDVNVFVRLLAADATGPARQCGTRACIQATVLAQRCERACSRAWHRCPANARRASAVHRKDCVRECDLEGLWRHNFEQIAEDVLKNHESIGWERRNYKQVMVA